MAEPRIDPASNTFTVTVATYQYDRVNEVPILDDKGERIVLREIGEFTFKVPTIAQSIEVQVRKAERLRGQVVEPIVEIMADAMATLPILAQAVPEGFGWDKLHYPKDADAVVALWGAFNDGLKRFRD